MIVTIVGGALYERMAALTVPLMRECLRQSVKVVPAGPDPWLQKLQVLHDAPYIFVDADIVFRKRIPDVALLWLGAAAAGTYVACEPEYRARLKLPPDFLTTGIFAVDPHQHARLLEVARSKYTPGHPTRSLKDEYALNEALRTLGTPVWEQPLKFQRVLRGGYTSLNDDDISRHFCGGSGDLPRLAAVRAASTEAWRNLQV